MSNTSIYFLDTEFNEGPVTPNSKDYTIDLISIGIKARDSRCYYAINFDFAWDRANEWVKENVINQLPPCPERVEDGYEIGYRTHKQIASEVLEFLNPEKYGKPEIWANFNSHDWVGFCWLWGAAVNLPKGFPFYCRELKQECDRLGIKREQLPPKNLAQRHHALEDAKWNEQLYDLIETVKSERSKEV
jgi:hypothetical protein